MRAKLQGDEHKIDMENSGKADHLARKFAEVIRRFFMNFLSFRQILIIKASDINTDLLKLHIHAYLVQIYWHSLDGDKHFQLNRVWCQF